MTQRLKTILAAGTALVAAAAVICAIGGAAPTHLFGAAAVDTARQKAADSEPGSWMSAGRTYDEQRYSPLTQINASNVSRLGLAWFGNFDTERGQESTPVVVDGVLYVTSAWSMVKAYNAKTGEKLWQYDPKVDPSYGQIACCDVVNRGVAAWKGRIYLAALDGRLIALDGKTGEVIWSKMTVDPARPYTVTGTPRIINGKVIIGNGGSEYRVRGYLTAYDAETGDQKWRWYAVPGDPSKPFEQPELKMAAQTWKGQWWEIGGGGTPWDGMAYDPSLNLLYIGTGNGDPWNQLYRSPGGGDNLFLTSIVALDPDTGRYKWHYQETNGETWDHTATQPLMVATLKIGGRDRRVVMQAPKNGFFYVLDAKTGALISADKFAPVNWADRVDLKTGRPVQNPAARYDQTGQPAIVSPGPLGAHNWHPISFSPRTGLVYLAVQENNQVYGTTQNFRVTDRSFNTGVSQNNADALYNAPGAPPRGQVKSYLQAWDPVQKKEVWRVPDGAFGGHGTMVTASDIVFSGDQAGVFSAFEARTGAKLWSVPTQARVVAAPATYTIDGEQYVAILVGGRALPPGAVRTNPLSANNSRILVYKLGGTASLPTTEFKAQTTQGATLNPPLLNASNEDVIFGEGSYGRLCSVCHGSDAVADKSIPDLRYTTLLNSKTDWDAVVVGGARASKGMPSFGGQIGNAEAERIQAYVISRANQDKAKEQAAGRGGGRGGAPAAVPARGGRGG